MTICDWRKLKDHFVAIATVIGILVPIYCFYAIPHWNIKTEPLSKFGIAPETKYLWIIFTQCIAIMLYISNDRLIKSSRTLLKSLNFISSISLSMLGIINMEVRYIHIAFAALFFLCYTGFMFWWGVSKIRNDFKNGIFSVIIALIIMLSTITMEIGYGYGPFEITFITSIIIWNIKIRYYR